MEIRIKTIGQQEQEYIEIGCRRTDQNISEIVSFIKSRQGAIDGMLNDRLYQIPIVDIFYIESVDDRTFLYLEHECYESRKKLYEFEELLTSRRFARISKAVVLNLMKVVSVSPALNGRFLCKLTNGESVIISRKYVPAFKEKIKG